MNKITTSQTIGPFSHEAWQWGVDASAPDPGEADVAAVDITGVIHDGSGAPINDAQIEAWIPDAAQAESARPVPGFRRIPSGAAGEFHVRMPAPPPSDSGAPAMYVTVFARGLLKHQFTAVFLEDAPGLAQSAILNQVPEARRATLIAHKTGPAQYRWDIWMQSDKETVFFDYV
ncbi:MAG TPA: protocatechuate 3,4-dioxygenase [Telluria sp.]